MIINRIPTNYIWGIYFPSRWPPPIRLTPRSDTHISLHFPSFGVIMPKMRTRSENLKNNLGFAIPGRPRVRDIAPQLVFMIIKIKRLTQKLALHQTVQIQRGFRGERKNMLPIAPMIITRKKKYLRIIRRSSSKLD